ncbi:ArsR/SmtB family transcription factor [Streptomyces lydicus]|uniref:ArsR/SmtB family transcription factor n=1 Tax=Streptomyces lydicus TaxID=47763 RepID=UPI0009981C4F|nr:helix-turn-helix domain-containing protein [Streptomyces lydicus]MDC7337149.1 helix-turn-helix domain-containing protein [Streptomyces lydicus]UEG93478.1 helix-turn-helix domain-containing protein [Streptomyces lydicus]
MSSTTAKGTGKTGGAEKAGGAERAGGGRPLRLDLAALQRPVPPGAPDPLPEPDRDALRLDVVMGALSDPLRMRIVRTLLLESEAFDHTCGWFGLDRPKSSLTHHFRALREAGLIRQRQYGLERRSHVRVADLETRFPGLLGLVADWRE